MVQPKTALVTGAGRGIGRAIALELARAGFDAALNYNTSASSAQSAAEEIRAMGRRALTIQADIGKRSAVEDMVAEIKAQLGPISLLVNNAGLSHFGLFQDTDEETWQRLFDVNVTGAYRCIRAVLPDMLSRKAGNIINITSVWGFRGASCETAYSATKAALVGLTRSLAAELAPSNIRVNAVAPGCIDTQMLRALGGDTLGLICEQTPMGRIGNCEDVARVVRFLASDDAAFMTGQVLTVDGGFTL